MLQTADERRGEERAERLTDRLTDCDSHNAEKLAKIRMRSGRTRTDGDGWTDRQGDSSRRERGTGAGGREGEANPIR